MPLEITTDALATVTDRESLYAFLRDSLGWPVDPDDPFTYDLPDVNDAASGKAKVGRIVPFTGNDPYVIMLAEFDSEIRRGDLRRILQAIRKEVRERAAYGQPGTEDFVFVCAAPGYSGIRFAQFREREGKQPRLRIFGWDRDSVFETRTLREVNLPVLRLPHDEFGSMLWSSDTVAQWNGAWNVEKVTDDFFRGFEDCFEHAKTHITGIAGDDLRLFTQRLFNRLLFIRFLEKKGWLHFKGRRDLLMALWEDHQSNHRPVDTFYSERLVHLFFSGLNNPQSRDHLRDNPTLHALVGDIPYLNGGLFEEVGSERNAQVPDISVGPFLADLLYHYNFTITESTPDDVDVAVDPEMLGKVFEKLVTGRHESGSYYTPKPVVSFMCREALKGYLGSSTRETEDTIAQFVDEHHPGGLKNPEAVLGALKSVKACDPACGSGAYLLGILHELLDLRACLFSSRQVDPLSVYDRKLEIIQNSVYGVDLDQFAVNIARLRLWLSLAVDFEGAKPEPLPNLDFKVEQGDSLTAPSPEGFEHGQGGFRDDLVRQVAEAKSRHQRCHDDSKPAKYQEVIRLKRQIAEWTHSGKDVRGFDWPVEFTEVFAKGGFDIIVMNPPYLSANRVPGDQRDAFQAYLTQLAAVYGSKADLYVFFVYRALQLLSDHGYYCAITSNTFFTNTSKEQLRRDLLRQSLKALVPLSGEVFTATVFSAITLLQKGCSDGADGTVAFLNLRSADVDDVSIARSVATRAWRVPQREYEAAFAAMFFEPTETNRRLFARLLSAVDLISLDGRQYAPLEIIAPALDAGINSGNVREKLFHLDAMPPRRLHRLLQGRQIVRYGEWWSSPAAKYRYVDVDFKPDPTKKGIGRGGKPSASPEHWHIPNESVHAVRERILLRQTEDEPFAGYICQGEETVYTDNTLHTLILTQRASALGVSYQYLLAILNSSTAARIYQAVSQEEGRTLAQVKTNVVNRLPIPIPTTEERSGLERLVAMIQAHNSQHALPLTDDELTDVANIQAEINERVARLYGV